MRHGLALTELILMWFDSLGIAAVVAVILAETGRRRRPAVRKHLTQRRIARTWTIITAVTAVLAVLYMYDGKFVWGLAALGEVGLLLWSLNSFNATTADHNKDEVS